MSNLKQVIRNKCLWCCNNQSAEIVQCPDLQCGLYRARLKQIDDKNMLRACISIKCLDCSADVRANVTNCDRTKCPLWEVRL